MRLSVTKHRTAFSSSNCSVHQPRYSTWPNCIFVHIKQLCTQKKKKKDRLAQAGRIVFHHLPPSPTLTATFQVR